MKKLKVGIVGCGGICNWAHLPAYQKMTDIIELVACADIVVSKAEATAKKYNIPHVYDSVEALLAGEPDVDYIDICTWTAAHAPVCIAAAKAGKNIFCEKPLAATMEQGLAMEKAVKEAGVKFELGVVTRYGAQEEKFIELRDQGVFGDIYCAKTAYVRRRGTPGSWFTDKAYAGGGPVLDIGVHAIDRTWYLMGKPKPLTVSAEVSYRITNEQKKPASSEMSYSIGNVQGGAVFKAETANTTTYKYDTEDSALVFFRFEGGKSMTAEVSWVLNGTEHNGSVIFGTKAGCSFSPLTIYSQDEEGKDKNEVIEVKDNDFFEEELRHFVDCINNDKTPISSMDDAVTVLRMLDGIYRSAEAHREVEI